MEAKSYAGAGKVYEKEVSIDDVAWIDDLQGQYAPTNELTPESQKKIEEVVQNKYKREDGRNVFRKRTIRVSGKIETKAREGGMHNLLTKNILNELGFDAPEQYFDKNGKMAVSREFVRVLEQGNFRNDQEWHHLFLPDGGVLKVLMAEFVNKYYKG